MRVKAYIKLVLWFQILQSLVRKTISIVLPSPMNNSCSLLYEFIITSTTRHKNLFPQSLSLISAPYRVLQLSRMKQLRWLHFSSLFVSIIFVEWRSPTGFSMLLTWLDVWRLHRTTCWETSLQGQPVLCTGNLWPGPFPYRMTLLLVEGSQSPGTTF